MSPTSYRTAPPRAKVNSLPKHDLQPEISNFRSEISMVGLGRVELPTSRLSGVRSNQLSYRPISSAPSERKKQPHFSSLRSVITVDAPEGAFRFCGYA